MAYIAEYRSSQYGGKHIVSIQEGDTFTEVMDLAEKYNCFYNDEPDSWCVVCEFPERLPEIYTVNALMGSLMSESWKRRKCRKESKIDNSKS